MSDDEQLAYWLLLQQLRQLGRKLPDTVRGLPVGTAVSAEVDRQPTRGPPLLQRSPHRIPYRGRRAQAVQQQGPATTLAAALVPDHGVSSLLRLYRIDRPREPGRNQCTARLMLLRVHKPSIAATLNAFADSPAVRDRRGWPVRRRV